MSYLRYNGLYIHLMKTASLEMDNKRDKVGNQDVVCNTTTIRARGIISQNSGTFPSDSATTLATVRHMLNMPRRELLYQINGVTIISWAPTQTGQTDADHGPNPVAPAAVREVTPGTFFVEVSYKVSTYDCGQQVLNNPVVSLRWTQTESFDENWNSHLETTGTLKVRPDLMKSADSFRDLATPPILDDYRRVSSKYTLSPNGDELDFHFSDVEVDRKAPYPAIKASGRFVVNVQKPGAVRYGQVTMKLEGAKGASRFDLMVVAIARCYSKLQREGVGGRAAPVIWGTFGEDLFEPVVEVSMQAMLAPIGGGILTGAVRAGARLLGGKVPPAAISSVGFLEGYEPGVLQPGIAPPMRKRLGVLLAAAFRDPCLEEGLKMSAELRSGGANPDIVGTIGNAGASIAIGVTGTNASLATADAYSDFAPYDEYRVSAEWVHDSGDRMLPGTGVGSAPRRAKRVSVHGGKMTLEVNWTASRTGAPPVLPTFLSQDSNLVPLTGAVVPEQVEMSPDGATQVYRVSGHYVYGVLDPGLASVLAPIPPFLAPQQSPASVAATANYSDGVMWRFTGQAGANPFFSGRATTNENPSEIAGNAAAGIIGGFIGAGGNQEPPGGLGSVGGALGGLLGGSGVNA